MGLDDQPDRGAPRGRIPRPSRRGRPELIAGPDLESRLERPAGYDLRGTAGSFRHGPGDPTIQLVAGRLRRATRTPEGPATFEATETQGALVVRCWGPGAAWVMGRAGALLGLDDDPGALLALEPPHAVVRELARRHAGLRIGRTDRVVEALVPAVIEQKITGMEARRVYRALVLAHGEPAPGPFGLRLQPAPERLAALPYYAFHPIGLERRRAETLRRVGALAERLESAASLPPDAAHRRLGSVPGIGPWTVGEVTRDALGDPDAVSVGDYHLPSLVAWALAGERRADDARMLELLEPYRGQRGRVIRLLERSGLAPEKRGPRMPDRSIAGI